MNNYKFIKKMQRLRKWYTLTAIEQALFYELIEVCNQAGWTDLFLCSNSRLSEALNLPERTLIRARKHLMNTGLISYRSGKSMRNYGSYSLSVDLNSGKELTEKSPEVDPACYPELPKRNIPEQTDNMQPGTEDATPDETTDTTPDETTDETTIPATDYNKTKTKEKIKKECVNVEREMKEKFELFRRHYPGMKRGLETEFKHFRKKHPDYAAVIDELRPAVERLKEWAATRKANNEFVPHYPLLSTWINQRRWETELETSDTPTDENTPTVIL